MTLLSFKHLCALILPLLVASLYPAPVPRASAQEAETLPFDPAIFNFGLDLVTDGLDRPVHVADPGDGSGRLFVVEQAGRVRIVRNGQVDPIPFLDITPIVQAGGNEQGLLSIAFHPHYPENGEFYLGYTARSGRGAGDNTVARYRVSPDDANLADPTSGEIVLAVPDFAENHNGGLVMFGPDGYLYVGLGDGGGGGDPNGNGQNPKTLLGSLLRLDVDHRAAGKAYAIPPDNPFADGGGRPEIWAYGLRNPWRFSFDRETGDLYLADVGQGWLEEVNFQAAESGGGENYGWNIMEGSACFESAQCDTSGLTLPVAEYTHDLGCSITGGFVYRGAAIPALRGVYLFADFCSGLVWGLGRDATGGWILTNPIETGLSISSFGEAADGELYLTDLDGALYQVVTAPQ